MNYNKQTYDTLRSLYLDDLQNPDIFHGRSTSKVRWLEPWKNIQSRVVQSQKTKVTDPYSGDIWVWSDIHWGHKNILKYSYPHRLYNTVDQMNHALIDNYLQVVKPQDTVIFGGDIGFMSANNINAILDNLPGYKIHIVGNHDIYRDGTLYHLNFDETHLCMVQDVVDPDGYEYQLLFTHYPLDNVPDGCQSIHGHIHQNIANEWNTNICVEHTQCAPQNLRDFLPKIRNRIQSSLTK